MSSKSLSSLHEVFRARLREALLDQVVHVGFDLWSSVANENYIIITVYWVSEDFYMQSAVLAIVPLQDQYAETIVRLVRAEFSAAGVDEEAVFTVCTDGASNEQAAACFPGFASNAEHVWCMSHKLNLMVGDGFEERVRARGSGKQQRSSGQSAASSTSRAGGGSEYSRVWAHTEQGGTLHYTRDRSAGVQRVKDLCENLNISYYDSVADAMEDDMIVDVDFITSPKHLWDVARRIIVVFRRSHSRRKLLEEAASKFLEEERLKREDSTFNYNKLVVHSRTRWIGSLKELQTLLQYELAIKYLQDNAMSNVLRLPSDFFDIMREVTDVLGLFSDPVTAMQFEDKPVASYVPIFVSELDRGLRDSLTTLKTDVALSFCRTLINR